MIKVGVLGPLTLTYDKVSYLPTPPKTRQLMALLALNAQAKRSVKVLVVVAGFGLNDAVTPLGRPEANKLMLPLKPFRGVTPIALEPLAPCVKLRLLGAVDSWKLGVDGDPGQLFTKLVALSVPMPVAKSQPKCVP